MHAKQQRNVIDVCTVNCVTLFWSQNAENVFNFAGILGIGWIFCRVDCCSIIVAEAATGAKNPKATGITKYTVQSSASLNGVFRLATPGLNNVRSDFTLLRYIPSSQNHPYAYTSLSWS